MISKIKEDNLDFNSKIKKVTFKEKIEVTDRDIVNLMLKLGSMLS
jgi:hypothetical protein